MVPLWRCPILKPLSAKLPPKSETAPHPGWQDGTILGPGEGGKIYISKQIKVYHNSTIGHEVIGPIMARSWLHYSYIAVTSDTRYPS